MDSAETFDELLDRFVHSKYDETIGKSVAENLLALRDQIEKQGRLYELREMVKYHHKAMTISKTEDERTTHLADIVVLEARISYLENPRETPPVTSL
jgi:hypothetical protein